MNEIPLSALSAARQLSQVSQGDAQAVAQVVANGHRTHQANAVRVALAILEAVSSSEFDLRNEAAVRHAATAVKALKDANDGYMPGVPYI